MEIRKPTLACDAPAAELIQYPVLVSAKVDGIRATHYDGQLYTRSLKLVQNAHIQKLVKAANLPASFDGELVVGPANHPEVYRRSTSGIMSRDGEPDFTWWLFDFVPGVMPSGTALTFSERWDRLQARTQLIQDRNPWIKLLPHAVVETPEALLAWEQKALDLGYEGVMVRSPHAPYKHGRSTQKEGYLMKVKRFVDSEAYVVGVVEEMENTNPAMVNELGHTNRSTHQAGMVPKGTLGALICRTPEGIEFSIGGGFTAAQRLELWQKRDTLGGLLVKYKHFEIGVKDKPRFPVWLGFRDPSDL